MKKMLLFTIVLFLSASSAESFTISNFENPQCVRVDPDDGSYYVANTRVLLDKKEIGGYLSKISANGNIVFQRFIGGKEGSDLLREPRGLAFYEHMLVATDMDTVKVFDKKKQKLVRTVDLGDLGAKVLSGIAVDPSGVIYVGETKTNRIFKIEPKKKWLVSVFREGAALGRPSGLLVNPRSKNLMLLASESGQLLEIDRAGRIHVLRRGLASPMGLDYDNAGNLYVSSMEKGEIYKISVLGRGALSTYLTGLTTPADISYDRKKDEILIPSFKRNTVTTLYKLKSLV